MKINNQLGFSHFIVPVIVVLLVGGIGAYLYENSHAATTAGYSTHCHDYEFSTRSGGAYLPCVADIQDIIKVNALGFSSPQPNSYYKYSSKSVLTAASFVDGYYGPNTAGQVENYQAAPPRTAGGVDGIVGPNTWKQLCSTATLYVPSRISRTTYDNACE
jgi:peptidoglycan hydrolase-like protein with peptidoglycan-binding domain